MGDIRMLPNTVKRISKLRLIKRFRLLARLFLSVSIRISSLKRVCVSMPAIGVPMRSGTKEMFLT